MAPSIRRLRRRIFLATILTIVGALLATAVINLVIDPYGTFRLVDLPRFNRIKPYPDHDLETIKDHALRHVGPDAIILGNSRAEVGFDPLHPVWRAAGYESVYNAAVAGAGPTTAARLLDRALHSAKPPRFILLGVDFFDFPVAANSREIVPVSGNPRWADTLWRLRATLTMQALLDSATTLRRQFQHNPEQLTLRGHNPLLEYLDVTKAEGYWVLFRQRAEENAKNHARKPRNIFLAGTRTSPSFDDLRGLVHRARESKAELRLVVYPYHAQLLVLMDELGFWPLFEDWKRQLVRIAEEESPAGGAGVSVLDFSGFSEFSTEAVPARNDKQSSTRWYWEAGHFKKSLGDVMLEPILGRGSDDAVGTFGAALTSRNVEQHLARLRESKDNYRLANPEVVNEIRQMLGKAG